MIDIFLPRSQQRGASGSFGLISDWFNSVLGVKTRAGVAVSEATALNYSAVACATRIISETAAQLPLKTYQRLENGGKQEAPDEPLFDTFQYAPNPHMGAMPFREMSTVHMENWGNSYSEIVQERDEVVLWPIHPSRVDKPKVIGGELVYEVRNNTGAPTTLRQSEVLHIPGVLSEDGINGKGIISLARESIGGAVATDRHGAAFFGNGARPGGVLSHPTKLEKDARDNMRREWKHVHGGPDKACDIAVLYEGVTYTPISVPNNDAQFLETRTFNITEIARWYRVPPYMLADLTKATYSNVEFMGIEFVIYTMLPWLRRWEDGINRQLIPRARRREIFVEHNVAALLRGDMKSRYESYKTGIIHGWLTINDILRLENMNPIGPDGDQRFFQRNMTTVERLIDGTDNAATAASSIGNMNAEQQQTLRVLAQKAGVPMGGDMIAMPNQMPTQSEADNKSKAARIREAAVANFKEVATGLMKQEICELGRASKACNKFTERAVKFYEKHHASFLSKLTSPIAVCDALDISVDRRKLEDWFYFGKAQVLAMPVASQEELSSSLQSLFDEWSQCRVSELINSMDYTEKAA